jgi:hypothetical protein
MMKSWARESLLHLLIIGAGLFFLSSVRFRPGGSQFEGHFLLSHVQR